MAMARPPSKPPPSASVGRTANATRAPRWPATTRRWRSAPFSGERYSQRSNAPLRPIFECLGREVGGEAQLEDSYLAPKGGPLPRAKAISALDLGARSSWPGRFASGGVLGASWGRARRARPSSRPRPSRTSARCRSAPGPRGRRGPRRRRAGERPRGRSESARRAPPARPPGPCALPAVCHLAPPIVAKAS